MRTSPLVAILTIAILPLSFALVGTTGCNQYYEPPEGWEGSYTGIEVLNKALERAESRVDPMEGAVDLTVTAAIKILRENDPIEATYVVRWKQPDKFAIEVIGGPLEGKRIVCDGNRVAEIVGGKVTRADLPRDETGITQFMNRLFVLHFFRSGGGSTAAVGQNAIGPKNEPWIHLEKTDAKGRAYSLLLDSKSLEPKVLRTMVPFEDDKQRPIDTYFENYTVDPRAGRVPMLWKSYDGKKLSEELRIGAIAWNQGIPDTQFALPSATP